MNAQIRLATVEDMQALIDLRLAFLTDFFGEQSADEKLKGAMREYFARAIPARECIAYLAESGNGAVAAGCAVFRSMPPSHLVPDGREAYIFNMYTEPEYRGRGIATAILQPLIEDCRRVGCPRVSLHAAMKARPLYQRAGFEAMDGEMRLVFAKTK